MTIRILLADDRYLILETIKAILEHEPEIEIVGTAHNGQAAIAQAKKLQPDLLLIDIEMPVMNGIKATKYIAKYVPNTKIIILTSHKSQEYLDRALQAGACGYLLKNSLIKDLKKAIYSLDSSNYYIDAQMLTKAVNKIQQTKIAKYQQRIVYLKKYQKSIYVPSKRNVKQNVAASRSYYGNLSDGMTKENLAGIFEPALVSDRVTPYRTVKQERKRKYPKKVIWILIAIASFVLSLIIF